jgi:isopentenyl-diphosphate delta-isomerase type 1
MGQDLDELFDVVDEQDRVVGQAPRRVVHANGWRHRAIHVLVFNRAGQVFLHKRSATKDLFPGAWDSSCAGHVGAGEDYDPTAVRELAEELGVKLSAPPLRLFKLDAQPMTGAEFVWVYRLEHEGPFVLDPDEIECGGWFAPAEVDRWIAERPEEFAPALRLIWSAVRTRSALG